MGTETRRPTFYIKLSYFLQNILKSQYKEYLKINKNLLIAAGIDFIISAFVAQQLSELEPYLNTTVTLIADFVTYFSVFISLFFV